MLGGKSSVVTVLNKNRSLAESEGYALLLVNQAGLRVVPLPRSGAVTIGRGKQADVRVADVQMSRQHIRIHVGDVFRVEDLGSANGTIVGAEALPSRGQRELGPGEPIYVGATTVLIRDQSCVAPATGSETLACEAFVSANVARVLALANLASASMALGPELSSSLFGAKDATCMPEASPHVILFLAANPIGTTQLALDAECQAIEDELDRTPHRDDFEFHSKWVVTVDDMMRHLNKLQPTIVHFSGHGGGSDINLSDGSADARDARRDVHVTPPDGGIELEGKERHPQYVTGHALTDMITSAARSVRVHA